MTEKPSNRHCLKATQVTRLALRYPLHKSAMMLLKPAENDSSALRNQRSLLPPEPCPSRNHQSISTESSMILQSSPTHPLASESRLNVGGVSALKYVHIYILPFSKSVVPRLK